MSKGCIKKYSTNVILPLVINELNAFHEYSIYPLF